MRVHANPRPTGKPQVGHGSGIRPEVALRILGQHAVLNGVAGQPDVALAQARWFTGRDLQLRPDDIDAGDSLGCRVLDLDAGVGLDEVEAVLVVE